MARDVIVGIYKITSPAGKVYVGQSWNIYKRWGGYKNESETKSQTLIYRSISKHGISSHKFEILHQLPKDIDQSIIDAYESLYIELYKSSGHIMLNLKGGGSYGKHHQSSKDKVSNKNKGRKRPLSAIISTANKNRGRK